MGPTPGDRQCRNGVVFLILSSGSRYLFQPARLLWHANFPIFDWRALGLEFLWSLVSDDEKSQIFPINGHFWE